MICNTPKRKELNTFNFLLPLLFYVTIFNTRMLYLFRKKFTACVFIKCITSYMDQYKGIDYYTHR